VALARLLLDADGVPRDLPGAAVALARALEHGGAENERQMTVFFINARTMLGLSPEDLVALGRLTTKETRSPWAALGLARVLLQRLKRPTSAELDEVRDATETAATSDFADPSFDATMRYKARMIFVAALEHVGQPRAALEQIETLRPEGEHIEKETCLLRMRLLIRCGLHEKALEVMDFAVTKNWARAKDVDATHKLALDDGRAWEHSAASIHTMFDLDASY
jgi:hypothetical protein